MNKLTGIVVGAIAVLAAVFGVVALTAGGEDTQVEGASEFQNVVVTGDALPKFPPTRQTPPSASSAGARRVRLPRQ